MNIIRFVILAALLATTLPDFSFAQQRNSEFPRVSPNASISQTVGVTDIAIHYGRPSVKGRKIFGHLEPFEKVWRTGANEATTITFTTDVTVEGKFVPAGMYALFTIPGQKEWTIILNSVAKQWGAYSYDSTKDVLRVKVKSFLNDQQEEFLINFEKSDLYRTTTVLHWDRIRVPFNIQVHTDSIFRAMAQEKLAAVTESRPYFNFAFSALLNNILIPDAIEWTNKALTMEENYNNLAMNARLLGVAGRYQEAIRQAERALVADQTGKVEPPILPKLSVLIAEWRSKS